MEIQARLQQQYDHLGQLYEENLSAALSLQSTLLDRVLPDVVDELELDSDQEEELKDWLWDAESVFRLLKRHRFTSSFALEAASDILIWRAKNLPQGYVARENVPLILCLPPTARDFLGRPILVLRISALKDSSEHVKEYLMELAEDLRVQLQRLNSINRSESATCPILQYSLIVDVQGASLSDANVDLPTWYIREVVPRFPGMLAAVLVVNYSWAHSGVWNIMKHVLPDSTLSKVFFPSEKELLQAVPPSSLPEDYGGSLPKLEELFRPQPSSPAHVTSDERPHANGGTVHAVPFQIISTKSPNVSATSQYNPFFGYPVRLSPNQTAASVPSLYYGRQRKRDLLRTLAVLLWEKWKKRVAVVFAVLVVLYLIRRGNRRFLKRHLSAYLLLSFSSRAPRASR
ncbi:CRAL/TRIO domain-containing protein [Dentipellis sp. KUC8613]|nr:CRAL/TRIO domain-containing protein [Dentipellis sp. KUC8613]